MALGFCIIPEMKLLFYTLTLICASLSCKGTHLFLLIIEPHFPVDNPFHMVQESTWLVLANEKNSWPRTEWLDQKWSCGPNLANPSQHEGFSISAIRKDIFLWGVLNSQNICCEVVNNHDVSLLVLTAILPAFESQILRENFQELETQNIHNIIEMPYLIMPKITSVLWTFH